ncbi:rhodanese-like domain-containing protein [Gimesia panareensis]|nr:rhodanese-like domain-containing protein [Gimesia panareensis]
MRHIFQSVFYLLMIAVISILLYSQFGTWFAHTSHPPEITLQQLQKLRFTQKNKEVAAEQLGVPRPKPQFVLVDVRSSEETNVSMIPGAITRESFEKNIDRYRDRTVIAYCTIGYRSGKYTARLIEQGITAKNFKGSIIAWCASQLELVTPEGKATHRVHTYSSKYKVPALYEAVW